MVVKDINDKAIEENNVLINDDSGEMVSTILVKNILSGKLEIAIKSTAYDSEEYISAYPDGFWRIIG